MKEKTTTTSHKPYAHYHRSPDWEPLPGYPNWFRARCDICGAWPVQAFKEELRDYDKNPAA